MVARMNLHVTLVCRGGSIAGAQSSDDKVVMILRYINCALVTASLLFSIEAVAGDPPRYKPSSRSPEPIDLSANVYGGSLLAPAALAIGEKAPDFTLPVSGGGTFQLQSVAVNGPVVIVFYRGHW